VRTLSFAFFLITDDSEQPKRLERLSAVGMAR
jgi:hypothetical protein